MYEIPPAAAALSETEEEVSLKSNVIVPSGDLDGSSTATGFHIVPLVAMITPDFLLRLDPTEDHEAFEVSLDFLMNGNNHEIQRSIW